jgi:hypothetical protein
MQNNTQSTEGKDPQQTKDESSLDGASCSPRVFIRDDEPPTPETDAAEWNDPMRTPSRVVESDFARKLERQRDGAFSLIDYAGELLDVPKQDHKSAHGFKILLRIKELVGQQERANRMCARLAECDKDLATALREIDFLQAKLDEARQEATDYMDADAHGVEPTPFPWENVEVWHRLPGAPLRNSDKG